MEKNTTRIMDISKDFEEGLKKLISEEKKKYEKMLEDDLFVESREFKNLIKLIDEILKIRMKKIVNLALVYANRDEELEATLTPEEEKLLKQLIQIFKQHYEHIHQIIYGPEKEKETNLVTIKILQDLDEFIAPNLKKYGPFSEGEIVTIDEPIGKILVENGFAEYH